jgi:hypothetical protein
MRDRTQERGQTEEPCICARGNRLVVMAPVWPCYPTPTRPTCIIASVCSLLPLGRRTLSP